MVQGSLCTWFVPVVLSWFGVTPRGWWALLCAAPQLALYWRWRRIARERQRWMENHLEELKAQADLEFAEHSGSWEDA